MVIANIFSDSRRRGASTVLEAGDCLLYQIDVWRVRRRRLRSHNSGTAGEAMRPQQSSAQTELTSSPEFQVSNCGALLAYGLTHQEDHPL